MKFNFKIQPFQTEAVDAIVRVFNGQPKQEELNYRRDLGSYEKPVSFQPTLFTSKELEDEEIETGYRNVGIRLSGEQLLKNIREIQTENNINLSSELSKGLGAVSLDVEMETGTGKTYVYIKTMFELHKRYGWSKYIVVVPSIAIREGVKKSFEITQEHFMELYNIKARFFIYNSSNLHQLDEFSSGSGINVMIINIQAFASSLNEDKNIEGRRGDKAARIIYTKRDEFGSRRPIDVIKANHPIIILDEPQKMGGEATQNALKNNFNPLFSMNYSATHKTTHNLVYVLDALDAFQKKLVKKIEVKGFEIKNLRGTDKYLYLAEILVDPKKPPRARLEFETKYKTGIKREMRILNTGDSLYSSSNELDEYKGISIAEVDPLKNTVTFSNGDILIKGNASGNVNESDIRRIQIRETIYSHFEKEEALFDQGIKCLSLFFIDEVAKYRQYDDNGEELLGEYGKMFEEEYKVALEERLSLFPTSYQEYLRKIDTHITHRGYFSIDKQGRTIDSEIKRGTDNISDDISAYDLILKRKELLLSLDEHTRFIFSHSALREGWDNPNVFQICTLKYSESSTAKRQEVGRGLRICVNQAGDRQDIDVCGETVVHELNKLTVIASESYTDFVSDLQREIKDDLYERPMKASAEYFTDRTFSINGETYTLTVAEAKPIYHYLIRNDYIDDDGAVTQVYRDAAESGQLAPLKEELIPMAEGIHKLIQAINNPGILNEMIVDGHETKFKNNPLNDNFFKKEFQELWKAINGRYAYTVEFDSSELVRKSSGALNATLRVTQLQYTLTKGIQKGAEFDITRTQTQTLDHFHESSVPYDLVGKIAESTTLTRRSVTAILKSLNKDKMYLFRLNPEEFIQKVTEEINRQKAAVVIDHISYQPSAEEPYTQDIFNISKSSQEYAKAFQAKKAIQDFVFTDGTAEESVERKFAKDLDTADEVIVYAKLPPGPRGFFIPTPVGNYSPDWAIAFKRNGIKHVFFIAETKGTMDSLKLRPIEQAKITCAKKLFNEISTTGVKYHDVDSYKSMLDILQKI